MFLSVFIFSVILLSDTKLLRLSTAQQSIQKELMPGQLMNHQPLILGQDGRYFELKDWRESRKSGRLSKRANYLTVPGGLTAALKSKQYAIEGLLGEGGSAYVYAVSKGNRRFAAKVPRNENGDRTIQNEIRFYREIGDHEDVLRKEERLVYQPIRRDLRGRQFRVQSNIMIMEYGHHKDLRHILNDNGLRMRLSGKVRAMKRITTAMVHLNSKSWHHLDLKPDNIVVSDNPVLAQAMAGPAGKIKLADFGLAMKGDFGYVPGGTEVYLAPEAYSSHDQPVRLEKLDVFALGITFFEILYERRPWNSAEAIVAGAKQKTWRHKVRREEPHDRWQRLFDRMLDADPRTRASLEEVSQRLDELQSVIPEHSSR